MNKAVILLAIPFLFLSGCNNQSPNNDPVRVTLNLFSDANGTRLYDINKITQITASGTVHGSSGYKYCKP